MGMEHRCPNCRSPVNLNAYTKVVENGYCQHCGEAELRSAVKYRKALAQAYQLELAQAKAKLAAEELKTSCLTSELKKYKPAPCRACNGTGVTKPTCEHVFDWFNPDLFMCTKCGTSHPHYRGGS